MQNPIFHSPGKVPWQEWDLSGHKNPNTPGTGWIETAYTRKLALVENVIAIGTDYPLLDEEPKPGYDLFPFSYSETCDQHQNMVPHYGKSEIRPNLVRWEKDNKIAWGSHQEQDFRARLSHHPERPNVEEADQKALDRLLEFLTPKQKLDLWSRNSFVVKSQLLSSKKSNVYFRINYLNGVSFGYPKMVEKGEYDLHYIFKTIASHCYHGKVWLPGYDVMLTTLLLLRENEEDFLKESSTKLYKSPVIGQF